MSEQSSETRSIVAHRPAYLLSDETELDAEFRAARWAYHRLLDFEDEHQALLDKTQEEVVPGIGRVGRVLSRLRRREKRRKKSTQFVPRARPELQSYLEAKLATLRTHRNADSRWQAALKWATESEPDAHVKVCRRKAGESDEDYQKRSATSKRRSRREAYRVEELYPEIHCHYDTWNALVESCDQATRKVLSLRKLGMPAERNRPRWSDPNTLTSAKPGHYQIIERGKLWWVIEMRLHGNGNWVRFRAKIGNWHAIPKEAQFSELQLTRRRDGNRWSYTVSLLVKGMPVADRTPQGVVAFDWGHREHQHPNAHLGVRAFVWRGDDGRTGEVLIPTKCRESLDKSAELQSRIDDCWNARAKTLGLSDRNRHSYRNRLLRSGVRTNEEQTWLSWERKYERRIAKCRRTVQNVREQVYLQTARDLRKHYAVFVFEDESSERLKRKQKDDAMRHRQRENRDMATRHEFIRICERYGAVKITVPARNTTRECPEDGCGGILPVNGPELMVCCPKCGVARDKDEGAARVILRRGQEALANQSASI